MSTFIGRVERYVAFGAALAAVGLLPSLAFGTIATNLGYVSGLVASLQGILNTLIPFLITLAVVIFFWGLVKFILSAGDEEARASGRNLMIWGIVALFVIVGVWGLVALVSQLTGVGTGGGTTLPYVVP